MSRPRAPRRLVLIASFIAGCSADDARPRAEAPESATSAPSAASAAAAQGVAQPVSNYKDERKAQAMRGLAYDTGRVVIVPEQAAEIAPAKDRDQAEREYALGVELREKNARIEAIAAHTKAVLLAPDVARMYEGLGLAFLAQRMVPQATAALRSGLDLDPASSSLHFHLADALNRAEDRTGAVAELREALRLEPDLAPAHERLAVLLYYTGDEAGAWFEVHRAEELGQAVPPQFRVLLAQRMPEPTD
jgi:tetratricopeptide (TPR) repeat protein